MPTYKCKSCGRAITARDEFEFANLWCLCKACFDKMPKMKKRKQKQILNIIDKTRAKARKKDKTKWDDVPF